MNRPAVIFLMVFPPSGGELVVDQTKGDRRTERCPGRNSPANRRIRDKPDDGQNWGILMRWRRTWAVVAALVLVAGVAGAQGMRARAGTAGERPGCAPERAAVAHNPDGAALEPQ